MRVLSVIHQEDAPAGTFGEVARGAGCEVVDWNIAAGPPPSPPESFDAALVFGGSPHPDQERLHPWLRAEAELLRGFVERGTPVLGVCLGAETLAQAVGADVGPAAQAEIGWYDVELTQEGEADPVLGALPRRFTAFQWHSYGFGLPPGGVPLARNPASLQAYRFGEAAWGVQFHPEVTEEIVRVWAASADGSAVPPALLERTAAEIGRWTELGRRLCAAFVRAASR